MPFRPARLFHSQLPAIQLLPIDFLHRPLRLLRSFEHEKSEASGLLGHRVQDNIAFLDSAAGSEERLQVVFCGFIGKVGDVKVVAWVFFHWVRARPRHLLLTLLRVELPANSVFKLLNQVPPHHPPHVLLAYWLITAWHRTADSPKLSQVLVLEVLSYVLCAETVTAHFQLQAFFEEQFTDWANGQRGGLVSAWT